MKKDIEKYRSELESRFVRNKKKEKEPQTYAEKPITV